MLFRLLTVADDYGRFPADPRILLAACFPLRIDRIKTKAVASWWKEITETGIAIAYMVGGVLYGYFPNWKKYQGPPRAKESKYPDPANADDSNCAQMRADVPVLRSSISDLRSPISDLSVPPNGGTATDPFETFWQEYPKPRRKGKFEARRAWTALHPTLDTAARIMASLAAWKASADWTKEDGKYIPWPQKFLNRRRWEEMPEPSGVGTLDPVEEEWRKWKDPRVQTPAQPKPEG